MLKITPKSGPELADAYGRLKAEQADLARREKTLKAALLALNAPAIDGRMFRVTISSVAPGESLDLAALRRMVSAPILAACTKLGAPTTRFAVKARVAAKEAA